jgi:hypothetical protein
LYVLFFDQVQLGRSAWLGWLVGTIRLCSRSQRWKVGEDVRLLVAVI